MATAVTGTTKASMAFTHTPDSGFFSGQGFPLAITIQSSFSSGTTADTTDKVGAAVLALTASNAQTVNLQTDLYDPQGVAVAFAEITSIGVQVVGTNASQYVRVKEGAANGWTNFITATNGTGLELRASTNSNGSGMVLTAPNDPGWTVNATNKTLLFTPSAHAASVKIVASGRSA